MTRSRLTRLGYINISRTADPVRTRVRSRGVPAALQDHLVFASTDLGETSRLLTGVLGENRLLITGSEDNFSTDFHAVRLRDVSMAYLDIRAVDGLDIGQTPDCYLVLMPTNGTVRATGRFAGAQGYDPADLQLREQPAGRTEALVIGPRQPVILQFEEDSPAWMIRIERAAIEVQMRRLLGRSLGEPVTFDPYMSLATEAAARWNGAMQLLSSEVLSQESLIHQGIGLGPMEDLIVTSLLLLQPSNYLHQIRRDISGHRRPITRRGQKLIESAAGEPLTVATIARDLGTSVRTLQQAFRQDIGMSPMTYLRNERLDRVRAELADAVPADRVSVTEIASRWQFNHLGHFARSYRDRFGETPSQTLRR